MRPASCRWQAFDDCTTVAATFKLLESFEGMLDRDAISRDLELKHVELVRCGLSLGGASWNCSAQAA